MSLPGTYRPVQDGYEFVYGSEQHQPTRKDTTPPYQHSGRIGYYNPSGVPIGAPQYPTQRLLPLYPDLSHSRSSSTQAAPIKPKVKKEASPPTQETNSNEEQVESHWNSLEKCVPISVRIVWEGTKQSLKEQANKNGGASIRSPFISEAPIIKAIKSKLGKSSKAFDEASSTIVSIYSITVVQRRSDLPHDVGILFTDPTKTLDVNVSYVDSASQESYMYIVPADCREDSILDEVVYKTNDDIFSPLVTNMGGISLQKLKEVPSYIGDDDSHAFIPVNSVLAKVVFDTINARAHGATGMMDPELATHPNGEPLEINPNGKSYIQVSSAFIHSFIEQYKESVLATEKPVDLLKLQLKAYNTYGKDLGVSPYVQDDPNKVYRLALTLKIMCLPRYKS